MSGPPRVFLSDLAEGAADGPILDDDGAVQTPLIAIDLSRDTDPATLERAVRSARDSDRLLIGLLPGDGGPIGMLDALDLTLARPGGPTGRETVTADDPDAAVGGLHEAAIRNPLASLILREVLRTTEMVPVPAALDVESYAYSTLLGGPEFARWLEARGPRPLPPHHEDPVLVDRDDRAPTTLRITLNRPERRNAYGRQLRDALVDALHIALHTGGIERVILDGAGPAFCAGGDLDEFGTAPDLSTAHMVRTRAGAGRLVHRLADRTEVRVHGPCVGAGIEIPAFAGTVVAHPDTTFRLPEVAMGLIPGAGGTVSIPRRIGRWRTLYLALTGTAIGVDTARSWGLIDR
ncbi:enoyl-CoA hydratase/isomerase family protein [Actinomadura madurae]|uniref:enoyl-CoA hydratase/isomerase family protein n=1 Tax=Actinomadura madurae TaxID=1993 RepID=UPI0020D1FD2E|nr:enoyl-CoA hydratase/isomerase family protein [Actinomadura madurae]MCP9948317.1 enoyl-CoA hydratase/isomerase family protein [Actinomadura madurae]MCP9965090.1 enoyl-CoA hydratase/isomerase family protein [Actinomadura madurae]MCP9977582.1 enoyl-CoA hydratase/isomerase family protein [Actinomadura madurae]MCQ0010921.1 enoyl-CoA hydratase/isomerase family protein [Actinomadura madurae]